MFEHNAIKLISKYEIQFVNVNLSINWEGKLDNFKYMNVLEKTIEN